MEPELLDMSSTVAKKTIKLFTSSFLQRYRSQLERLLPDERRPDHAGQDSIAKPPRKGLSGGDTRTGFVGPTLCAGRSWRAVLGLHIALNRNHFCPGREYTY